MFGAGTLWEKKSPPPSSPITDDCGCYCHKLHEKEEKEILAQIREDRMLLQEERARESEKIMKSQEEYCSQPFRVFLEEYGNCALPH